MIIVNMLLEYTKMMLQPLFFTGLIMTVVGFYLLKRDGYRFTKGVLVLLGIIYVGIPALSSLHPNYNGWYALLLIIALTTLLYRLKKEEV